MAANNLKDKLYIVAMIVGALGFGLFKLPHGIQSRVVENYTAIQKDLQKNLSFLSWGLLEQTDTQIKNVDSKMITLPIYPTALKKFNGKQVNLKGYMIPIDANTHQARFILSPVLSTCPYCMPVGPNQLVIVELAQATKFTDHLVATQGTLVLLPDNQDIGMGVFYRLVNAHMETY